MVVPSQHGLLVSWKSQEFWVPFSAPTVPQNLPDVAQVKQIAVAPADAQVGMVDGLDGRWKDFGMVIDFLARMVYRCVECTTSAFQDGDTFDIEEIPGSVWKIESFGDERCSPNCGQIDQMYPLALVALVDSNGRATPSPPVFSWSNGYVMSYTWGFWSKIFIPSHNQTLQWEIPKLNRGLGKFIYK